MYNLHTVYIAVPTTTVGCLPRQGLDSVIHAHAVVPYQPVEDYNSGRIPIHRWL